jgi:hypothetical protein
MKLTYEKSLSKGGKGRLDLEANRYEPFSHDINFYIRDLTGFNFKAQVRLQPNEITSEPLLELTATFVSLSTTTIQQMIDDKLIDDVPNGMSANDTVNISKVSITAPQSDIEDLFFASNRAENVSLFWDLQSNGSGIKNVELAGYFHILPGVTQWDQQQ